MHIRRNIILLRNISQLRKNLAINIHINPRMKNAAAVVLSPLFPMASLVILEGHRLIKSPLTCVAVIFELEVVLAFHMNAKSIFRLEHFRTMIAWKHRFWHLITRLLFWLNNDYFNVLLTKECMSQYPINILTLNLTTLAKYRHFT